MGDVTDRQASAASTRPLLGREGSNLGSGFGGGGGVTLAPGSADLREILRKVEPLQGSSRFTKRDVDEILQSTMKMVGETSIDWNKRLTMLKTFRSLCSDPSHHGIIVPSLRHLFPPLEKAVKDLRSQVSREACITVALLTDQLGLKSESFIELLLPTLFTLLVANAKVVSLTSCATIYLIYESVPSWRLIPTLQTQMLSKSKDVRRAVCEVLKIVLHSWPTATLLKHANLLHEVVKKGLLDADADARVSAREAFPAFQATFPGLATSVLDSLDSTQRRQMNQITSASAFPMRKEPSHPPSSYVPTPGTNGSANYASLTRQGSMKKTSIPVLASRMTPTKTPGQGRSTSAIDLQAANRARQHHFSTMRSPLKYLGRTNSSMATPNSSIPPIYKPAGPSSLTYNQIKPDPMSTAERSRTRSRISPSYSQSQPGSRSNSPSSRYTPKTSYSPHHTSANSDSPGISHLPQYGGRGFRRISSTSSASSSRDTSPQGRILGPKSRSRSVSNSPQVISLSNNSGATAKMLLASREAESVLSDALRREQHGHSRDYSEVDYGNHSDSEDSLHSHRSYLSETFSPPATGRHMFMEDNVEDLLSKCGSAKWSERKEGLLGLQSYLQRHGSIPSQHFNRIGQTFCRIFMDAHTKVLSLFLDVLHAVLYRHARDLVDFTTILLNRILTKLGSDLLTSVHTKLMKTLEIIMEEMPSELQFSAVTHYLCDPTQTPNSRSRIAALSHIHNLSSTSITIKGNELQQLVDKILDWCVDMRSQELRRISQKVFYSLFGMAAPQMTIVLGQMSPAKQDQAKAILKNIEAQEASSLLHNATPSEDSGWSSINSNIQSLRITPSGGENDIVDVVSQMLVTPGGKKGYLLDQLYSIIKESSDAKLIEHHKDVLKVVFDALADVGKASDKVSCFFCLEEMCSRPALNQILAAFAELFLVRVTDVHVPSANMPREVTKSAENCGMAVAGNFPPEIIARALCPIVHSKEYPVNQLAIKMLQRLCESCELSKLRSVTADIITTLIGAYDHPDSAVRKAAVFAIVAVHCRLGSEIDPYLSALSGSKLKLLQLYIQRAEHSAS